MFLTSCSNRFLLWWQSSLHPNNRKASLGGRWAASRTADPRSTSIDRDSRRWRTDRWERASEFSQPVARQLALGQLLFGCFLRFWMRPAGYWLLVSRETSKNVGKVAKVGVFSTSLPIGWHITNLENERQFTEKGWKRAHPQAAVLHLPWLPTLHRSPGHCALSASTPSLASDSLGPAAFKAMKPSQPQWRHWQIWRYLKKFASWLLVPFFLVEGPISERSRCCWKEVLTTIMAWVVSRGKHLAPPDCGPSFSAYERSTSHKWTCFRPKSS